MHYSENTRRRRLSLLGATALGLLMAATVLPAAGQAPSEPDLDGVSFSFQGEDGDGRRHRRRP